MKKLAFARTQTISTDKTGDYILLLNDGICMNIRGVEFLTDPLDKLSRCSRDKG
jgi:hypothetical protein